MPVRRQHQRGDTAAGLESLGDTALSKSAASRAGRARSPVMTPSISDRSTSGVSGTEQALLAHRVAIMPGHTNIRPGLGHHRAHGQFSTPVDDVLPVCLPS